MSDSENEQNDAPLQFEIPSVFGPISIPSREELETLFQEAAQKLEDPIFFAELVEHIKLNLEK
jgi:hypothetical protein